MKRYLLFGLLVAVLCTPLLFVAFLLAAAQLPALDRVTMAMPMSFRSAVASIAVRNARSEHGHGAKLARALRLDPQASQIWPEVCSVGENDCPTISTSGHSSAELSKLGEAKERAGDFCGAEKEYAAASQVISGFNTDNSRALGRTMLRCGQTGLSISEFKVALSQDTIARDRQASSSSADDPDDNAAANVITDQEWISIAYRVQKQPGPAEEACNAAHPELHPCVCNLVRGKPSCSANVPPPAR